MENLSKKYVKEFTVFLILNCVLLDNTVALYFFIAVIKTPFLMAIKQAVALPYFYVVFFNKLLVLPVCFNIFYKYAKDKKIKRVLEDFRNSLRLKLSFLFIIFLLMPLIISLFSIIHSHGYSFYEIYAENLYLNTFLGAYQAYIVLYLYWWIKDIFKKIRQ